MKPLRCLRSLHRPLLPALLALLTASCASTGSLRDDPGFLPAPVSEDPGLPRGLNFDAGALTAPQCVAWLDRSLQPYIWHGEELNLTLTHGRVTFTEGVCRQYRTFDSPALRTWHVREIPLGQVTPASLGEVSFNDAPNPVNRNYSFNVSGPWIRKWETMDLATQKVTSRGSARADRVTLSFTSRAAARQARAVMLRLLELMPADASSS